MKLQNDVQKQIFKRKSQFFNEARYWRNKGLPIALQQLLTNENIDFKKVIVFDYEQNYPGCSTDFGKLVTENGVFYSFDADFNADRTKIIEVYEFNDITNQFKINGREKGIGKTDGFLIMEILVALNEG